MPVARLALLLAAVFAAAVPAPFAAAGDAPAVTGVEVTSEAGADATYALGETIRVAVTFSEAVDVTGAPGLAIDMDPASWGEKRAAYASGSGTASLVFAHRVVEPNYSTQGIAVLADTLALDGGTIRSAASGADASLTHAGLPHDAAHKVDWRLSRADTARRNATQRQVRSAATAPAVTEVEVTSEPRADATYALGETIEVTVRFSEAVDVTGAPGLSIDMDPASWGEKQAVYARGSGTAALVFAHAVVEPNLSTQGIAVLADTLALDGGTIRSASSGAAAALAHTGLPHNAAHKVDWRLAPRAAARSNATPDDTTPPELVRGEVDGSTMRLTFSEALDPDATGGRFMVDLATEPLSSAFPATGGVTVEGAVVTVELGAGNPRAEAGRLTGNRATYIRPADGTGGALRDLAGNPVAAPDVMPYGGVETWRGSEEWRYVGIALDNVTAPPPDTTPPELVRGEIDGGTVTLWFSEALDPAAKAGRFHVQVEPAADMMQAFDAAGAVAIDGNRVTVGVGAGKPRARAGLTELNYAHYIAPLDPAARGLRDLAGNPVATPLAFHGGERGTRSVKLDNVTVAGVADTAPPRLSRTVVDGTKLTLAFNEAIDDDAPPANGAFTVKKTPPGGTEEAVGLSGTPAVEGAAVTLTLAKAVRGADTGVKVSYRRSGSDARNRLRDKAGNEVAEFSDRPVANAADTTPPELVRGEIDDATMTFFFSEPLDENSVGGYFRAILQESEGSWHSFTATGDVEISGNAVTIGLGPSTEKWVSKRAGAGLADNFGFYYVIDPGASRLQDLAENPVQTPESWGEWRRTRRIKLDNVTEGAPPPPSVSDVVFSSDAGDGGTYGLGDTIRVGLNFRRAVNVTGTPRVKLDFGSGTGDERWADYAGGSGTNTLEFAYTVVQGDASSAGVAMLGNTLELNGGTIRSAATGEDAVLTHVSLSRNPMHRVDTILPILSRANVNGATLTLIFNEALGAAASLANSAFRVKKTTSGGGEQDVSLSGTPAIGGATVTLTLANAVLETDTDVKVSYARPTTGTGNRLADVAGNEVASFTDQAVSTDTTPPRLVRGEIAGGTMTLYFSEPLDPDSVGGSYGVRVQFWADRWRTFVAKGGVEISGNKVTVGLGPRSWWAKPGFPAFTTYMRPSDPSAKALRDLVGNPVPDTPAISLTNITTGPPSVMSGEVSSDAGDDSAYGLGEKIQVRLTFSEAVAVTGSPRVKIDLGSGADKKRALYEEGSGTTMLEFAYTVAQGDTSSVGIAMLANTLELNGGTIRSVAKGEDAALGHGMVHHNSNHRVDTTSPILSRANADGATLTLTFNEALGAAASLENGAFRVKKTPQGGIEQDVSLSGTPVIEGAGVTLTLANAVLETDTDVKVSYAKPTSGTGNRLRDTAGNEVASFSEESVANGSSLPSVERAQVDGTLLTITFDKALGAAASLGNGPFTVKKTPQGGSERDVSLSGTPAISGATVTLTLASAVLETDTGVKVSYAKPTSGTGNRLRDEAGNEVASFADQAVSTDTTPPRLVRGEIDGGTVTLYFSEPLDPDSAGGIFWMKVYSSDRSSHNFVASGDVEINGNVVTVGLGPADEQWSPWAKAGVPSWPSNTLRYIAPADPAARQLRDLAGNAVGNTQSLDLDNHTGEPRVTGVAVSSDAEADRTYARGETVRVTLTFNEAVNVTGAPRVKLDLGPGAGDEKWAAYAGGSSTKVLEFAYTVAEGDASDAGVAVLANTLALNGGTIQSASAPVESANLAHAGRDHDPAHRVDTRPPMLSVASVNGATLKLAFNEPLGAAASLTNDAFTVKKTPQGGIEQDVSLSGTPAIGGRAVTLTLANAVLETDTEVKVSYAKPASGAGNRLQDKAGNEVKSFSDEPVTNVTGDTTPPELVRGEVDGETMTLYFSEALDPDSVGGRFRATIRLEPDGTATGFTATGEIEISGNTVTVGLGSFAGRQRRATAGEQDNLAHYARSTDPSAESLRDLAGNPVWTPRIRDDGWLESPIITLDNLTGVARLSVADARANEGAGAAVAFEVSLSRAAADTVTVDYATADGTAAAGADYTATSGTLTFAAGETEKTVSVPVLDDSLDEGKETFTLRLSNAQGGWITDGEATGTITNDDPLQTMWLSRFGRTVASHVTDAVSDRLAAPLSGAQVTVGGQRVDLAGTEDGKLVGEALTAVARALGASEQPAQGDGFGPGDGQAGAGPGQAGSSAWPGTAVDVRGSRALDGSTTRDLSGRELLLGSAFHLAREGDGTGPGLAAWGRVTFGGFDGEERADAGSVRIDGEVTTGILGADAEWSRLLAGVAVSVSEGEGTFSQPGVDSGTIESSMTAVSPYARFMVNDRVSVWGLAGWGTGDMTIVQAANDRGQPERTTRTDIEMRLGAIGGRGALMQADESGGFDLGLKADAFWVETESDPISNEGGTTAVASRVRLALEGSRAFGMEGGGTLTPGLEVGLRHDGGDAETGTGVELGGRVTYTDPETGLSVEARVRTLVAHEDSDYREWGASGAVRLGPGERGRGLSFSLSPTWGAAAGGVERLWSARDARGVAPGHGFEPGQRLEGELGYGLGLFGDRFTGTPNLGFGFSDTARDWRIGWRLTSAVRGDPGFEVNLDATRRESANDNGPASGAEHGVMLRGAIRW